MRCAWVVVLSGLVACYRPSPPEGAPCGDNRACPSGLACVAGVCTSGGIPPDVDAAIDANDTPADAPVDSPDANPSDLDGDGVPVDRDNCPDVPNADQRDFDADDAGDVCDGCPHLAGPQADDDQDGVGNACDPWPAHADHRLLFRGFYDEADIAGWMLQGTWTIDAEGGLKQTDMTASAAAVANVVAAHEVVLTTRVTFNALGNPQMGGFPLVGSFTGYRNAPDQQAYSCYLGARTPTAAVVAFNQPMGAAATFADWSRTVGVGTTVAIDADSSSPTNCQVSVADYAVAQPLARAGTVDGAVGFLTYFAAATYDYVFAVERGD